MCSNEEKDVVYSVIQKFLTHTPVVIWGSGATVPYGLPTMLDLNTKLKEALGDDFDDSCGNLEFELSKAKYLPLMAKIRKIIWDYIKSRDQELDALVVRGDNNFIDIFSFIQIFYNNHPRCVNIITTNYDEVLEKALGLHNVNFTDGFCRSPFSGFDEKRFQDKNIVNIIKVHGSLSWFDFGGEIRFCANYPPDPTTFEPVIVPPGIDKYRETSKLPYRELIQRADVAIKRTHGFLCVGFGFNDEHITPEIIQKIKEGTPIVLITKKASDAAVNLLSSANNIVIVEENISGGSKITIKQAPGGKVETYIISNDMWQLQCFINEVLK